MSSLIGEYLNGKSFNVSGFGWLTFVAFSASALKTSALRFARLVATATATVTVPPPPHCFDHAQYIYIADRPNSPPPIVSFCSSDWAHLL
ncbi:uncharacterized protein K452DRAFT_303768 [Aplosporella prunicola CBS 121167]|uniref:Uncharacterized protein n=1 Tax=Aplosporella prunicola CBS 121167 TaxID=1176127 RepID=A0A6A6AU70_9PEZI|nr:uncharacterized protein K452DRAFT_303768 [Aplosporella prunicola CBS 121167]KAF2135136.1 hypothetical protein K452DRAFT_303768 [Aplosporella prunicola CBS 121167]